jgi:pyridoxamine 5'-phosphate oxidase
LSIYRNDDFIFKKVSKIINLAQKKYHSLGLENYNAVCLSTCVDNKPSSRMVLLKDYSKDGFIFYTNLNSRKSEEIKLNPNVSMLFHFYPLKIQIRVEGIAKLVSEEVADEYFATRPYLSKIGAWSSKQSKIMDHMLDLHKAVLADSLKYKTNVPRPPHWSGFIVCPNYIEIWHEKPFRLHIRKAYKATDNNSWEEYLLYP